MFYLVTIGYETEIPGKNGDVKTKITKEKYLIVAESVEKAVEIANLYKDEDARESESISVNKIKIECVISPLTTPKFYK